MRVSALLHFKVNACAFRQFADFQFGIVQCFEIEFCPALFALADGVHRMGRTRQQNIGNDVRQLARLLFVESALGEPRCAEADARRRRRALVTGDGVAIYHHADDVEDTRRLVAAQLRAVLADDGGAVHVEHMAIRAAEGYAQSAFDELIRHCLGILDGLRL